LKTNFDILKTGKRDGSPGRTSFRPNKSALSSAAYVKLPTMHFKKPARRGALGLAALALAIQLIPGGRNHDTPPVTEEPAWDSPRTRELAVIACFDCHSHETRWPWYSNIAPVSFFVQDHVDEGRAMLNFSAWDKPQKYAYETA